MGKRTGASESWIQEDRRGRGTHRGSWAAPIFTRACNFPVAARSGAAATCERCVLWEVTGTEDHSPHRGLSGVCRCVQWLQNSFACAFLTGDSRPQLCKTRLESCLGSAPRGGASRSRLPPLLCLGAPGLQSHSEISVISSWLSWL